jgi:type I restriction enzyme S subunit
MKYAAYGNYKSSASEWLGFVPSHWHVDRLKWSTAGCYNGVWGDEPNEIDDLICVRVADFDRDRFVVVSNPPTVRAIETAQRRNRILQKNDLLIEKSGGGEKQLVGCVVQFSENFPAVCSNFVARLPVAIGCDPRYLTYLHSAIYAARLNYPAIKQTTGIQNLDSGEYLNILAAYPPLDEQQIIARFLDAKTAQIDELIAKKRLLIAKLKEKQQALIARTVTRGLPPEAAKAAGLEPNPEMKDSGVDWLGHIPNHWTAKAVRYIFRNCDSRRIPLSSEERADLEKLYPYYGASGVIDMVDDYLFDEPLVLVAEDGANLLSRSTPLAFLATGKYWVNNHAHILKPLAGDIRYWVATLETFDFSPLITGAAQPKLTADRLGGIQLPVPPANEQTAIADYLAAKTGEIDALVGQAVEVVDRLTEYRQALITSAVTGKIDVRAAA